MASDRGRQFDEYRGAKGLGPRKGPKGDSRLAPKVDRLKPTGVAGDGSSSRNA